MKSFEYVAPKNLKDATEALSDQWGKTEVMAGGTDLVTALKQNITTPERVVSLKRVSSLRGIDKEKGGLRIGALTTLGELAGHKTIQQDFPALVTAARGVGSLQLLSAGTVGGDLCQRPRCWYFRNGYGLFGKENGNSLVRTGDNRYHSIFGTDSDALFVCASSLGPVFVALGATMTVAGTGGKTREVPAAEFFQVPKSDSDRETALKPNEILTGITLPLEGSRNATYEVRHRQGLDWPYVTATVALREKGGGRVVLGHVAPVPWTAKAAGQVLDGTKVDEALAAKCGEAAIEGAKPLSGNAYKLQLVKAAVKRAALAAAGA